MHCSVVVNAPYIGRSSKPLWIHCLVNRMRLRGICGVVAGLGARGEQEQGEEEFHESVKSIFP